MATSLTEPALAESVILQPFESRFAMRALDELLRDTYFAIRMLRKSPVFAVVIVAMLAIGIGVNTAVFGVVNAILFRPLPVKDGARLQVIATYRAKTPALSPVSFPDLQDYRPATRDVFDGIAGYSLFRLLFRGSSFSPPCGKPLI